MVALMSARRFRSGSGVWTIRTTVRESNPFATHLQCAAWPSSSPWVAAGRGAESPAQPVGLDPGLARDHRHGGVERSALGLGSLTEQDRLRKLIALAAALPIFKLNYRLIKSPR